VNRHKMSDWSVATTADGKTYYWNKRTKQTQWIKPEDFDPPAQVGSAAFPPVVQIGDPADWIEARAPDGKTYYYNRVSKQTVWDLPESLKKQREQNARRDFVAGGAMVSREDFGGARRDDRNHNLPQKPAFEDHPRGPRGGGGGNPWETRQDQGGFRGPMPAKTDEPEYGTYEAAEEAFKKMMRRHNIAPDTPWEDALRAVVRDRDYRSIKDPSQRKIAFETYCLEVRAEEKNKEKERKEKVREEFRHMLTTHEELRHYTRWKTARQLIEREVAFKSAGSDDERKRIFNEYIIELKKQHALDEVTCRDQATYALDHMLSVLITDPNMTWAEAEHKILTNDRFMTDPLFKGIHKLDAFFAFENHMKGLERIANGAAQLAKIHKKRRQRHCRDAYKELLNELLQKGTIKAGSKWQDVFPVLRHDPRFEKYLGVPGSDPLDLFWDVVEDEERKLRSKRNDALDVLEEQRWEMTLDTKPDEFAKVLRSHPRTASFTDEEVSMIFDRLMQKIKRRAEDDKIGVERQQKVVIDHLRSAIRKLSPPVRLDDTYDHVSSLLSGQRDWQAADEDLRRRAFDKAMVRLREKEEDARERDRERERERERAHRERDRSRGSRASRDYRGNSRRGSPRRDDRERHRRHRTRSPEVDAYEADRRKAERDRQFSRKGSFTFAASSPRGERYDDRRRPDRVEYDRERRERDLERERNYRSRADPRDKNRTLDYGDEDQVGSRPPSTRKRRDSSNTAARENKVSRG
jgi:pre-mRNA-processing factor 40